MFVLIKPRPQHVVAVGRSPFTCTRIPMPGVTRSHCIPSSLLVGKQWRARIPITLYIAVKKSISKMTSWFNKAKITQTLTPRSETFYSRKYFRSFPHWCILLGFCHCGFWVLNELRSELPKLCRMQFWSHRPKRDAVQAKSNPEKQRSIIVFF